MHNDRPVLTPRLIVKGAAKAIELYERVFGAKCLERYETESGKVIHAALSIRGAVLSLIDEDERHCRGPAHFDGSPVLLHLMVDDPDATARALVESGGSVIIPIDDRFYGYREGRVADPYGHLWILSRLNEELEPSEIRKRVRQWEG